MGGQVMGAQYRPSATQLDDRDPAEVHRPHPEAVERKVEQGEKRDLEDPVVTDDDRPRVVDRGVAIPGDLWSIGCAWHTALGQAGENRHEACINSCLDHGEWLTTGCPRLERPAAPGGQFGAIPGIDLGAMEALPGTLADLKERRVGPPRHALPRGADRLLDCLGGLGRPLQR